MKIYTIGFTRKSAEEFFNKLCKAGVKRIIDVRLYNTRQLAGFAKKNHLPYFLQVICGIDYLHRLELAPTEDILKAYKQDGDWSVYERKFRSLMAKRRIEKTVPRSICDGACLLCAEDKPHHCHRRLVAEYLREKWGNVEIIHL